MVPLLLMLLLTIDKAIYTSINSTWSDTEQLSMNCTEISHSMCPICNLTVTSSLKADILDQNYIVTIWNPRYLNSPQLYSTILHVPTATVHAVGWINPHPTSLTYYAISPLILNDNSKIIYVYVSPNSWKWLVYQSIYAGSSNKQYRFREKIVEQTLVTVPPKLQGYGSYVWAPQVGQAFLLTDYIYVLILGNSTSFTSFDDNLYLLTVNIATASFIGIDRINIRDGSVYTNDTNANIWYNLCYIYEDNEDMNVNRYKDTFVVVYVSKLYGIDECHTLRVVKYKYHTKISDTVNLPYFSTCLEYLSASAYPKCRHFPENNIVMVCAGRNRIKCLTLDDKILHPIQNEATLMQDIFRSTDHPNTNSYNAMNILNLPTSQKTLYGIVCTGIGRCVIFNHQLQVVAAREFNFSGGQGIPFIFQTSNSSFVFFLQYLNESNFWTCSINTLQPTVASSFTPTVAPLFTPTETIIYNTKTSLQLTTLKVHSTDLSHTNQYIVNNTNISDRNNAENNIACTISKPLIVAVSITTALLLCAVCVIIIIIIYVYQQRKTKVYCAVDDQDKHVNETGTGSNKIELVQSNQQNCSDTKQSETLKQQNNKLTVEINEIKHKNQQAITQLETKILSLQTGNKTLKEQNNKLTEEQKEMELKINDVIVENRNLKMKSLDLSKYREWNVNEIACWILTIDNGRYRKYEQILTKSLTEEGVIGKDLEQVDTADIKGWGVVQFQDKKYLKKQIVELTKASTAYI
eukprot:235149_1